MQMQVHLLVQVLCVVYTVLCAVCSVHSAVCSVLPATDKDLAVETG